MGSFLLNVLLVNEKRLNIVMCRNVFQKTEIPETIAVIEFYDSK